MPLNLQNGRVADWRVEKIAVVGPGIVGMPMAAMLAHAGVCEGTDTPATVTVIQRNSPTSGWKVGAINEGRSPIGGIEPGLDRIVAESVAAGLLSASHDYADLADADVILVSVQTDKKGLEPDYGPLFSALDAIAQALLGRPAGNVPLIVIESTLAPSSMTTVVRERFSRVGLEEGRDVLLGNSPNRVMPGRLVERVQSSDKLVAGLHPDTPQMIAKLYRRIVTSGEVLTTNSMTAEVVKTLENAYRDVRIAYAAEIVRHCDEHDIDFFALRERVNEEVHQSDTASTNPTAVPSGALLVPTVGVGGHCLPKDGILLWWRCLQATAGPATSLLLEARRINAESPSETLRLAERCLGSLAGERIALLGTAYRFDSEDTRNSPTLDLAELLLSRGSAVVLHDPYVKPTDQNLVARKLESHFTNSLENALGGATVAIVCTAHQVYVDGVDGILAAAPKLRGVVDACNAFGRSHFAESAVTYTGIGRGRQAPPDDLVDFVVEEFRVVERGVANEVRAIIRFLNQHYGRGFDQVEFEDVRRLAATCGTGCEIVPAGPVWDTAARAGFRSRLSTLAARAWRERQLPSPMAASLKGA